MKMSRGKVVLWSGLLGCVLLAVAAFLWIRVFHHGPPPGIMKDIRAGIAARNLTDPDERLLKYLDGRYGAMSDPANRERVFLDFFNVEHIKAMQFLVKHSPAEHRQANIDAMANWVAAYRASLTAQEKEALHARFETSESQAMLRRATAQYNAQDVGYRGSTAPVISQLLRTIHDLQQTQ